MLVNPLRIQGHMQSPLQISDIFDDEICFKANTEACAMPIHSTDLRQHNTRSNAAFLRQYDWPGCQPISALQLNEII